MKAPSEMTDEEAINFIFKKGIEVEDWENNFEVAAVRRHVEALARAGAAIKPLIAGKKPCGECHLKPNEVCDICGAAAPTDVLEGNADSRLKGVIEHDRSKVADILAEANAILKSYWWLAEGRGSYTFDDDRWKDEFAACMEKLKSALDPMRVIAGDLSDSPVKWADIQAARAGSVVVPVEPTEAMIVRGEGAMWTKANKNMSGSIDLTDEVVAAGYRAMIGARP